MEQQKTISYSIITFSQSPGPRYCAQGEDSGEQFYHEALNKAFAEALRLKQKLRVILDGADGYASSFLDEAFGNLVYDFTAEVVKDNLEIVSEDEEVWSTMILNETIPEWEKRRVSGLAPRITGQYDKWFRLVDGELKEDNWK